MKGMIRTENIWGPSPIGPLPAFHGSVLSCLPFLQKEESTKSQGKSDLQSMFLPFENLHLVVIRLLQDLLL